MKYFIVILLLTFSKEHCLAQNDSLKKKSQHTLNEMTLAKESLDTIGIFSINYSNGYYVYNDFKDTIYLSNPLFDACNCNAPKLYKSIPLDTSGQDAVILVRKCKGTLGRHGGTFDISEKIKYRVYEIWNLDTKESLFKIIDHYKINYAGVNYSKNPSKQKGKCAFRYQFKIDKAGILRVTSKNKQSDCNCNPITGNYQIINGKYALKTD